MIIIISLICIIILVLIITITKNDKSKFTECELYRNLGAITGYIYNTNNCIPGYYKNSITNTCIPCPIGSYCNNNNIYTCGNNKLSEYMSMYSTDCRCIDGYYLNDNNICVECPANSYCINGEINPCYGNQTSLVGSTSEEDCKCLEGFYRNYFNNSCMYCGNGVYCSGKNKEICPEGYYCEYGIKHACPIGKTSNLGSTNQNECFNNCGRGNYLNQNNQCTDCPIDYYCPDGINQYACPNNSNTNNLNNRTMISDCICSLGFFVDPSTNTCQSINSIINSYSKKKYALISNIYREVSKSISGAPEFNTLRIMKSNSPTTFTNTGSDPFSFIPSDDNKKGFYCRIINICKYFNSSYTSIYIKRIILLDVNNSILNTRFRLVVTFGSYSSGDYNTRFQSINDINVNLEAGIHIKLLSVDEIDIKVYKIIILLGNGPNQQTDGSSGLVIDINNNAMYNNLHLSSSIPDVLDELTGIQNQRNSSGIEFNINMATNREIYKYATDNIKNVIRGLNSNQIATFRTLTALTSLTEFVKRIPSIGLPSTIPIVYPVDFDKKTMAYKRDYFNNIQYNSIFIVYLQDEFYNLSTTSNGLILEPDYSILPF